MKLAAAAKDDEWLKMLQDSNTRCHSRKEKPIEREKERESVRENLAFSGTKPILWVQIITEG